MMIKNVKSNYDTDIFSPIISKIESICNKNMGETKRLMLKIRVISDHIIDCFLSADGQLPSNIKSGHM